MRGKRAILEGTIRRSIEAGQRVAATNREGILCKVTLEDGSLVYTPLPNGPKIEKYWEDEFYGH